MPHVSILMPAYNAESTVSRALQSLVDQTFEDWECIVVDDGSTDQTAQRVQEFEDSRVRLFRLPENLGRPAARQKAIEEAAGDLICMLDADDFYLPSKLQSQVQFLNDHPEVDLVTVNMTLVSEDLKIIGVMRYLEESLPFKVCPPMSAPAQIPVPHAPSMLRRKLVEGFRFDPRLDLGQDFDFLLQVLLRHSYAILNEATYVYLYDRGMSHQKIQRRLNRQGMIYQKHLKKYPLGVFKQLLLLQVKKGTYFLADVFGFFERMTRRNAVTPSRAESLAYNNYFKTLS